MAKFQKIAEKLSHRENWTEELVYVHRTRLAVGLFFGFLFGIFTGWCFLC